MANDDLVGNMNTEWIISYFEKNNIQPGLNKEALAESLRIAGEIFI
jgi:hydroxymethylglutaryl-CoA lyase